MAKRNVRGVLALENQQTGDGRVIAPGAIEWADLPLPIAHLASGTQHVNMTTAAPVVGNIETITRAGDDILFTGFLDDATPEGARLVDALTEGAASHGARQGVSVDPDNWQVELLLKPQEGETEGDVVVVASGAGGLPTLQAAAGDPDPGDDGGDDYELLFTDDVDEFLSRYTRLRICGVTAVATPAFQGAYLELADTDAETIEGSDGEDGSTTAAVVPITHTLEATEPPHPIAFEMAEPDDDSPLLVEQPDGGLGVPFTVTEPAEDGNRLCFGHAALWGQCHIGYPGQCITAPESAAAYAHFHHGEVVCVDGTRVATGPLTMGCDHAAAHLRAPEATDHYAHSGLAFADVRASNGRFGVWVSGTIRPDVTDAQLRVIQASSLSGDWRRIGGALEFIGALAVNVPGFPIARESVQAAGLQQLPQAALAASAYFDHDVQLSLTAAGVVQRCPDCQERAMALHLGRDPEPPPGVLNEALRLMRVMELRTRHMRGDAASHAMERIRR